MMTEVRTARASRVPSDSKENSNWLIRGSLGEVLLLVVLKLRDLWRGVCYDVGVNEVSRQITSGSREAAVHGGVASVRLGGSGLWWGGGRNPTLSIKE